MNKGWILKLLLPAVMLGVAFAAETAFCTRVAVIDFESIGGDPYIGRAVTEIIRTELIKTGKYEVVERALLNKILEEQQFQLSDMVDATKIVELGKMLGADLILTGSVVKIGSSYTINARFIDVKTGAAKKAEAIRGYSIDELTYMSIKVIGILEQEVKPAPVTPSEKRPERPYVPVPRRRLEVRVGPRNYISLSLGSAAFWMYQLNDAVESANRYYSHYDFEGNLRCIDSGSDIEISFGRIFTEKFGLGFALGYLVGSTSGTVYKFDQRGKMVPVSEDLKVSGVFFSLRPFFRKRLSDKVALALGSDVGGIRVDYSEKSSLMGDTEDSGFGGLFGVFAGVQFLIQDFFLQADMGSRYARGGVELETGITTMGIVRTDWELDFSGPYLLLTAGRRF